MKSDKSCAATFDGNCLMNYVHGILGRHCKTRLTPDTESLAEFEQFIKPEID